MLMVQQLRMSLPPAHRSQMPTQRSRSRSRSQMRDNRSRGATDVSVASSRTDNPAVAIQKDWATVKAILTTQVLNLERTISEVQWALADCSTTIRLTDKKDVTQHVFEVVKTLPADMRFKVGITNELQNRFYDSSYAYSMPNTHAKDGIVYEGWILVYIDNQRRVVAMLEHNLIKMFTELEVPGIITSQDVRTGSKFLMTEWNATRATRRRRDQTRVDPIVGVYRVGSMVPCYQSVMTMWWWYQQHTSIRGRSYIGV